MANIKKIVLPGSAEYDIKDANALHLTAGSSEKLSGNLYINTTSAPMFYMQQAGTSRGYIGYDESNSVFRIVSNGGSNGLRFLDDGSVNLYANSKTISLRPNGYTNTTGSITLGSNGNVTVSGQIIGGHPIISSDNTSSSTTCSAGQWKSITSLSVTSAGTYLVTGKLTFVADATTTQTIELGISNTTNENYNGMTTSLKIGDKDAHTLNFSMLISGWSNLYMIAHFGATSGKVATRFFRAVRIS